MTLQDAIERGDIVEFRKFCEKLTPQELQRIWILVSKQPALHNAAEKILRQRGIWA